MTFVTRVLLIAVCNEASHAKTLHPDSPGITTISKAFREQNATDLIVSPRYGSCPLGSCECRLWSDGYHCKCADNCDFLGCDVYY